MNKKKNIEKLIILMLIAIIIILIINNMTILNFTKITNYNILRYDILPIDPNSGVINNDYWGISSNGTNSMQTREGINDAIKYAYDNGIEYVKLKKGTYLVSVNINEYNKRCIILKSNICLDLNGSKIVIEPNNQTNYSIFATYGENNISIMNGSLVGDRYEHNYDNIESSHEWGKGIDIRASESINIYNLEIYNMTGDGIFIDEYKGKISQNIKISNCNIYNSRRQGISVITGKKIHIFNNDIHNINGTAPGAGIDLEKDNTNQTIEDIYINNNKFYECTNDVGIDIYSNVQNVYIDKNEIWGDIYINKRNNTNNDTIYIGNNKFKVYRTKDNSNLITDLTDSFKDTNLKKAILQLVGKSNSDKIYESDIAKIASDNVPGGKQINLSNQGIKNLSGIENFAKYNIEWLYIDNNEITDLTPLTSLTSLTKLNASNNNISDISVLKDLTNLKTINLTNNNITDISIMNNFNSLEYVYLNNNKIKSLYSLNGKENIKEVYCFENEIDSIDNILNLPSLEKLDVGRNKIKNISTDTISKSLNCLNLFENNLENVVGLSQNAIESLNIKGQVINKGTGQVINTEYIQINLPQIVNIIDNTYNVEVKNISHYEFKDNYNSIIIPTSDFKNYGLNVIITKDNKTYINYSMKIDNSITQEVSKKYNVTEFPNEYIITGIDLKDNTVEKFISNSKFDNTFSLSCYKDGIEMKSNEIITTGTIIKIYNTEKDFYQNYTLVVYGDTNGDGEITSLDALNIVTNKLHYNEGNLDVNDLYVEAGRVTDTTRNSKLLPNSIDALAIVKDKLNIYKIKQ